MAFLEIKNVSLRGISACVPFINDNIIDIYKWDGCEQFVETTGIKSRRRADHSITASDLCVHAAEKLIEELSWDKSEIDALIFVTQTPDYVLPATSCVMQQRLGLSNDCYTLDISLGCSGWVYGLSVISMLLQNGSIKKGLLLAGDTVTKICSPEDKGTFPLFGDAGTATALEYDNDSEGMKFVFNTDGNGYDTIIVNEGGTRQPVTEESLLLKEFSEGVKRKGIDMILDGGDVFSFGITKAPKSVRQLCEHFDIEMDNVDLYTFHQANLMMNERIRKKLKLSEEKVPYSMDKYGNTSCASIPLTLVTQEKARLTNEKLKHVACGFGVGLSWGSVYFETDRIVVPELMEI